MLLLLADGTQVPVTELPGFGPWTFLVGVGDLVAAAPHAAADQPWAWRARLLALPADRTIPTADLDRVDLPVLAVARAAPEGVAEAVEGLLGRLGGGPGWAGIAPDAPPR